MIVNSSLKVETVPGEAWQVRFEQSPNTRQGLTPNKIILYGMGFANLAQAVKAYRQAGGGSVHLILGKDGQEVVQLTTFDRQAVKGLGEDRTSIALALDYLDKVSDSQAADPRSCLVTITNNKPRTVPVYPRAQLDALLALCVFLQGTLGLEKVLGEDELPFGRDFPGPAFPMVIFREKLFDRTGGKIGAKFVLEEVIERAVLRNGPGTDAPALTNSPLEPGTPVKIASEWNEWVRVEVMQEIEGNSWLVGWLEKRQVQPGKYVPVVRDNLLFTTDGRQYLFIPALESNYDPKREVPRVDVRFVVMHITTGPQLDSTVGYFRNPRAGVSAHLVVGRDGRVVQMVPFNRAAYQAGGGSWEGLGSLNYRSIGIEVDNAGMLTKRKDGSFAIRESIIPSERVAFTQQWRQFRETPWEQFTPIQLEVVESIVMALKEHYPIDELLEHEQISLRNRVDPGPLFKMAELREKVLGRSEQKFRRYHTNKETVLYENTCYNSPEMEEDYPKWDKPLPQSQVKILDNDCDYWVKIEVEKCEKAQWKGRTGWVRKSDVQHDNFTGKDFLKVEQNLYRDRGSQFGPPSRPLGKLLPAGTPVRVEKSEKDGWSLVATPEQKPGYLFVEGWVRSDDLEEEGGGIRGLRRGEREMFPAGAGEGPLEFVEQYLDSDPMLANFILTSTMATLIETFFVVRQLWTPPIHLRLGQIQDLNPETYAYLEQFYEEGVSLQDRLEIYKAVLPLVLRE